MVMMLALPPQHCKASDLTACTEQSPVRCLCGVRSKSENMTHDMNDNNRKYRKDLNTPPAGIIFVIQESLMTKARVTEGMPYSFGS